jgi:predicted DNA binding protein
MAVVAEFFAPSGELSLGTAFESDHEVTIELESVVPTVERALPFFWVRSENPGTVAAALREVPAITTMTELERSDDGALFSVTWDTSVPGIVQGIVHSKLTLLSATGTSGRWRFRCRTHQRDRIVAFQTYCREHGIGITLHRLLTTADVRDETTGLVTPKQRDTLLLALEEGYFDEPRRVSLSELGAMLGVSRQAVASRLRRGYRNLIVSTFLADDAPHDTSDRT